MEQHLPSIKEPEKKEKSNKKLVTIIVLFFVVVLTILFFNSQLSKITEIQITGIQYATSSEVALKSGLKVGDSFFFQSLDKVEQRIAELSAVHTATVTRSFPGVYKLTIVEHDVTAFEIKQDGSIVALLSSGTEIATMSSQVQINDKPVLTGWGEEQAADKLLLLKQLTLIPANQLIDVSEIIPYPTTAFPDRILIYTRTRFEVITTIGFLKDKIEAMNGVVETQSPGKITLLLADTYVPFEIEDLENEENN